MIAMKPRVLPQATLIYSPPGVGKTEFAAHYEDPVFIMVGHELGLITLINTGRVPQTPYWDKPVETWGDLLNALQYMIQGEHDRKTLVIDTVNGVQRLMKYAVVEAEFENDEARFESYGKGWERSVGYWMIFLGMLQMLRNQRGMRVVLLAHSLVTNFRNPEGDDYQKHSPELQEKHIWNPTNAWCDNVFFMDMEVNAVKEKGTNRSKGKKGKEHRQLYVEATPSHFAKNRFGLRQPISMGTCGREGFGNLVKAIEDLRKKNKPTAPPETKPPVTETKQTTTETAPAPEETKQPEFPTAQTVAGPEWVQTWHNRIAGTDKLGPTVSTFGDILTDYASAPEPDQVEHFPGIFQAWVKQCLKVEPAKGAEQVKKKLGTKHGLPGTLVDSLTLLLEQA